VNTIKVTKIAQSSPVLWGTARCCAGGAAHNQTNWEKSLKAIYDLV
jgi:hypothetical protein